LRNARVETTKCIDGTSSRFWQTIIQVVHSKTETHTIIIIII